MVYVSGKTKKALIKGSFWNLRFLTILSIVLVVFNILSTKVLPQDIFLVSAADIETRELVSLTNSERVSRGLSQLTVDSRLIAAAEEKGKDMLEKDYWAHYGPTGETPWQFIIDAGYDYIYAGENLAKDFGSAAPIHNAWMASPTHRSNLLNPNFVNIGIATVTGEFQGQETTIVVQMFGKAYGVSSGNTTVDVGNTQLDLPQQGRLEAPYISSPQDGDILKDGAFSVRGTASNGETIDIYDNESLIGTTSIDANSFNYESEEPYDEGDHILYAQAFDAEGDSSKISNFVSVKVDSIEPYIKRKSAQIEYVTISSDSTEYVFTIEVTDEPVSVTGNYLGSEVVFSNTGESVWEGNIVGSEAPLDAFIVQAVDAAGNLSQETFSSDQMQAFAEEIPVDVASSEISIQKWFVENVFTRIFTRSVRGQVNFIISLIMILLVSVERILLAKTGLTKVSSNPLLHLPVFVVLIFVSLIGGGGEVL